MLHRFVTWPTWWLGERRWSGRCGKSRSRSSSTRSDCLTTSCSAVSPWDEQTVNRFACGSFHMNFAFMLVNLASRRCVPSAFSGLQVRKLHVTNCNRLQFVTCWDILYWIIKVCFCTHDFWCGVWSFLYICTQQLFAELIERPSVGDVLQATSSRSWWRRWSHVETLAREEQKLGCDLHTGHVPHPIPRSDSCSVISQHNVKATSCIKRLQMFATY